MEMESIDVLENGLSIYYVRLMPSWNSFGREKVLSFDLSWVNGWLSLGEARYKWTGELALKTNG